MTLKSNWNIASDDEDSRGSFLSDYDSEFDLSPSLHRSTIDPINEMTSAFTSSILFPKQELANNCLSNSPIDGVNKLSDWFQSCTLDENKFNKNYSWSNCEANSYYKRPIISTTTNSTFSISQTPSFFMSSTSPTPLFSQQQSAQLCSRFAATSSNLFDSSSLFPKTSKVSLNNESLLIHPSLSSKICFTLLIFIIGLVLGYFLTNTLPPHLICHWFFILQQTSTAISVKSIDLFCNYLQIILQYISSNIILI